MNAQETRKQNLDKAKHDLKRLTEAINTLESNTADIPADDWSWAGDWGAVSHDVAEVANWVESAAKMSVEQRARQNA